MTKQPDHKYYYYKEISIPRNLENLFSKVWLFKASALAPGDKKFNILPGSSQCLIITDPVKLKEPGIFICGPAEKYIPITPNKKISAAGFIFNHGCLKYLWGIDPSLTNNSKLPLKRVISRDIYKIFLENISDCKSNSDFISSVFRYFRYIVKVIPEFTYKEQILLNLIGKIKKSGGTVKLNDLYDKFSISKRQIQRSFQKFTGITPKEFCRLERFQTASNRLVIAGWSNMDVMFDSGYYDQAHYNREFRKMTGLAPKRFLAKQKRIKVF